MEVHWCSLQELWSRFLHFKFWQELLSFLCFNDEKVNVEATIWNYIGLAGKIQLKMCPLPSFCFVFATLDSFGYESQLLAAGSICSFK